MQKQDCHSPLSWVHPVPHLLGPWGTVDLSVACQVNPKCPLGRVLPSSSLVQFQAPRYTPGGPGPVPDAGEAPGVTCFSLHSLSKFFLASVPRQSRAGRQGP